MGTLFGSISVTEACGEQFVGRIFQHHHAGGVQAFGQACGPKSTPTAHARIEYLAGLAVSVLIIVIGFELARTSLDKILHPTPVAFSWLTVAVLAGSIGVKLWMAMFNRTIGRRIVRHAGGNRHRQPQRRHQHGGGAGALVLGQATHLVLDGWMGLAVALFILYSGIGLIKETVDPLLGEAPSEELAQHIARKVLSYDGVLGTHDLMVHDYGPGRCFASVHVEMAAEKDVLESHDIIDNIERDFHDNDNIHLVIHYDPIQTGDRAVGTLRAWVEGQLKTISPQLSMHDFRTVRGPTHTNLIFDVVVPAGFALDDAALRARIQQLAQQKDTQEMKYYTVVTVDHSYAPYHQDGDEPKA